MQEWEGADSLAAFAYGQGLVGRRKPYHRLAAQLVPFQATLEWTCEQRRHLSMTGRSGSATADSTRP